jgi:hypothetical protein
MIKKLKARIERIVFSPIGRRTSLRKVQVAPVPTNGGFTIGHICGITGGGCLVLVHHGDDAINA